MLELVAPDAKNVLQALAWRLATNRELAGVHFRSDTLAGKKLAEEVFERLKTCPTFQDAIDAAKNEDPPLWE